MNLKTRILPIVVILVAAVAGVAFALTSQTVPSETFVAPAVTASACNSSTTPLTNTPNPTTVPSGVVTISCGTNPAFSVTTAGSDTPTFPLPNLGTGSTDSLYILPSATVCASTMPSGGQALTTGQFIDLTLGTYNYCWVYSGVAAGGATTTSFTIAWAS